MIISLVPGIPSRHKDLKQSVAIAFVPGRSGPTVTNRMGYRHPDLARIKAFICDQAGLLATQAMLATPPTHPLPAINSTGLAGVTTTRSYVA